MFTFQFQGVSLLQQFFSPYARCRQQVGDPGLPVGNGPCFVQGRNLDIAGLLQGFRVLEQDAVAGAQAAADHDGDRSSQAQGTGTADDQHADGPCQGEAGRLSGQQPDGQGHQGDPDDSRYKIARNRVCQPGDRRLGRGGIRYHGNDPGQGSILSHPGSPAFEEA